jgi:UDP-N-acetylglucosamine 2-epimerase (non-hydrolysing)
VKIGILVGTRPEIIKMSPIMRCLDSLGNVAYTLIHSNQHYSSSMDAIFFEELGLRKPDFNLNVGIEGGKSNQIGQIMIRLEPILLAEKIDVLLVQGDTNTVAAGALVASKLGIKIGHVEAGLRSYDRSMPEEGNRVITDHLSSYLFAVTDTQVEILKKEAIDKRKIFKVGNTIVDAVLQNVSIAEKTSNVLSRLGLTSDGYTLFTAHRASNVDKKESLAEVLHLISITPGKVCWPIHLRTKNNIEKFKLNLPENVIATEPLGYFDFLTLEKNAKLIVTDSGGLQEEACILGVPCITIRENTERPETVQAGANRLVGRDETLYKAALEQEYPKWVSPFGNGDTSELILDVVFKDYALPSLRKPEAKDEKVVMIGLGYMGIPTAILLANQGYQVLGVDINQKRVDELNQGILPFDEPGVEPLLKQALESKCFSANLSATAADIFIIAVPTPHVDGHCDLQYVLSAARSLIPYLKDKDIVIVESTVKPNTCNKYIMPIYSEAGLDVQIIHCPERAIPGDTLNEIIHNDRIVGGDSLEAISKVKKLYSSFVKGEIFETSLLNAECAKLMENTFRDVNIALANEFSVIAKDIGFDCKEAIALANRHPRVNILDPGVGVGGHCIPIDPWFLTEDTGNAHLIRTAREVNDRKPYWCIENLLENGTLHSKMKVGVLGVSYKKNVDDVRESPSLKIVEILIEKGFDVRVHDPHVVEQMDIPMLEWNELSDWADVFLIATAHTIFNAYQAPAGKNFIYL